MMFVWGSGFVSRVELDNVAVKFDGLDDWFVDLVEDTDGGRTDLHRQISIMCSSLSTLSH